jgi:hypothetical protein
MRNILLRFDTACREQCSETEQVSDLTREGFVPHRMWNDIIKRYRFIHESARDLVSGDDAGVSDP